VRSPIVSAHVSSIRKHTPPYASRTPSLANKGRSAAPIRTYRALTTAVVVSTAAIGSAQSSTAMSWAAPANTVALISVASAALSPCRAATTPNATP